MPAHMAHEGPAWDAYIAARNTLGLPPQVKDWTPEQVAQAAQVATWLLADVALTPDRPEGNPTP